jgi:maleylacetate reductase
MRSAQRWRSGKLGMRESDLDGAADLATEQPYDNPRPVTREDVHKLLQ